MAFRTNKVPAIEERTVSGSSVSFNSAFALPLKACKVSFSATQSGSGTPSPSNPRAISGVSAIGLNANSTPVSVSLGEERYGGELDVLTGELTVTDIELNLGQLTWQYVAGCFLARNQSLPMSSNDSASHVDLNVMFDIYKVVSSWNDITINVQDLCGGVYQDQIRIANSNYTDAPTFKTAMKDHYVVYQLAEPITIQLSANELSSILGNNTFSTDTGTLEITFSDLQEKSASGSVATFNTALAMPLSSCNIAVNAWQEGSGDPSPVNNRPIHGFSEVNTTRAGKNVWGEGVGEPDVKQSGLYQGWKIRYNTNARLVLFDKDTTQDISGVSLMFTKNGIDAIGGITFAVNNGNVVNRNITTTQYGYVSVYPANDIALEKLFNRFYVMVVIDNATYDTYEPYVTPTIYPIQLGQEVYGAEVDAVNGALTITHQYWECDDSDISNWTTTPTTGRYERRRPSTVNQTSSALWALGFKSNICQTENRSSSSGATLNNSFYAGSSYLDVRFDSCPTLSDFEALLASEGLQIVSPLLTPITIQLTPTQIATIAGKTNTIFADTGDIDLTFKDLDIAKRGNFREVFKLPS